MSDSSKGDEARPAGFFSRNWKLKLAALALAIVLWTAVRIGAVSSQDLPEVAVRVQLSDPDWSLIAGPVPANVQVGLTGPSGQLLGVAMARPTILIPIGQVLNRDTTIVLRPEWVRLQDRQGVAVDGFQPGSVRLSFEPFQTAPIPLSSRVIGSIPDSLAFAGPIRVEPLFVQARGPASRLSGLETAFLSPFDLSQVSGPGRYEVPVDTLGLGAVSLTPRTAVLTFELGRRVSRVVSGVPVRLAAGDTTPGLSVSPATAVVTLFGTRERLAAAPVGELILEVVPSDLGPMQEGQARRVGIRLTGLPEFIEGAVDADSATLLRSMPDTASEAEALPDTSSVETQEADTAGIGRRSDSGARPGQVTR